MSDQPQVDREAPLDELDGIRMGEALDGEGAEIAHVEFLLGSCRGPVGQSVMNGFTSGQNKGYTPIFTGKPNNSCPMPVLQVNKFMMAGERAIMQNFGPAQDVATNVVIDGMGKPWFKPYRHLVEKRQICAVIGIFIHGAAVDTRKIRQYNEKAIALAFERCVTGTPTLSESELMRATEIQTGKSNHPFADWQYQAPDQTAAAELARKQSELLDLQLAAARHTLKPWWAKLFG